MSEVKITTRKRRQLMQHHLIEIDCFWAFFFFLKKPTNDEFFKTLNTFKNRHMKMEHNVLRSHPKETLWAWTEKSLTSPGVKSQNLRKADTANPNAWIYHVSMGTYRVDSIPSVGSWQRCATWMVRWFLPPDALQLPPPPVPSRTQVPNPAWGQITALNTAPQTLLHFILCALNAGISVEQGFLSTPAAHQPLLKSSWSSIHHWSSLSWSGELWPVHYPLLGNAWNSWPPGCN